VKHQQKEKEKEERKQEEEKHRTRGEEYNQEKETRRQQTRRGREEKSGEGKREEERGKETIHFSTQGTIVGSFHLLLWTAICTIPLKNFCVSALRCSETRSPIPLAPNLSYHFNTSR
jgi:hypothetical protein